MPSAKEAIHRPWLQFATFGLTRTDVILVAEALAWVQVNPSVLDTSQLPLDLLMRLPLEATLVDRSSLDVAIETHLKRLAWLESQVCHDLQQQFGKASLTILTDGELRHWLRQLSRTTIASQPPSVDQ